LPNSNVAADASSTDARNLGGVATDTRNNQKQLGGGCVSDSHSETGRYCVSPNLTTCIVVHIA